MGVEEHVITSLGVLYLRFAVSVAEMLGHDSKSLLRVMST